MRKNEEGFTLLELLIVLTIISIVSLFVLPSMFKTVTNIKGQHYFERLQSDIFMIQNSVLKREVKAYIYFVNKNYIISETNKLTIKWNPEGLMNEYRPGNIMFSTKGNIKNPSSFIFKNEHKRYKLTFPFGSGRGYIDEL